MTMPPCTTEETTADLATVLRGTLAHLDTLDAATDGYLNALAFILHRVAAADDHVCEQELDRMEKILIDHASLSSSEAVLTVEMAKLRGQIADCCCSYTASRHMRSLLDDKGRARMRGFLQSVAEADGLVRRSEMNKIAQIASELQLDRS
jgi:uncharacterized tellurite resistance protein B-like protein